MFVGEPAQQELMPGAGAAVAHEAGHFGLVHRIDHGGRCAGAAERVADIDDVGDACALAAEFARHGDAEQPFGAQRRDRLVRETRIAIDRGGMRRRNRGGLPGALHKVCRADRAQIARGGENAARGITRRFARPDRCLEPPPVRAVMAVMDYSR